MVMLHKEYRQASALSSNSLNMLIMAACTRALRDRDEANAELLEVSWPDIWQEADARYCSPGACYPETCNEQWKQWKLSDLLSSWWNW